MCYWGKQWQHRPWHYAGKRALAEMFASPEEGTPKTERNVSGCLSLIPKHSLCICLPLFGFLAKQEVFWFPRSPNCPPSPTPWDEWCSPGDPVTVTCSGNLWRWLLFTTSSARSQTRDGIHRTPEAASGEGTGLPIHNTTGILHVSSASCEYYLAGLIISDCWQKQDKEG